LTEYGTWVPYEGAGAVVLGITLLAVGLILTYGGTKLKGARGVKSPGKTVSVFLMLIWVLSLVTFLVAAVSYGVQLYQENLLGNTPVNEVTPVTALSAVVAFIVIVYVSRSHGLKVALVSAFVGTAAAPMIFELPFDLIMMGRTYPPIPPSPTLYRLLFFLPLFVVEISTFSLLTLSPLTKLSKYTLFSLAGVFYVFAVWALLGFSYPSDFVPLALNDVSKVLSFVTAITLFLGAKTKPDGLSSLATKS
jgi:hypothetical protein